MFLHMRQSLTHTMQGLFLLHFWVTCFKSSTSFLTFLLVSFHMTTCIMPRGHLPQITKLTLIYLYFVLLSSLCYSFRFKKRTSQLVLQMSVRMQLICILFLYPVCSPSDLCFRNFHLSLQGIKCNIILKPTWNL